MFSVRENVRTQHFPAQLDPHHFVLTKLKAYRGVYVSKFGRSGKTENQKSAGCS